MLALSQKRKKCQEERTIKETSTPLMGAVIIITTTKMDRSSIAMASTSTTPIRLATAVGTEMTTPATTLLARTSEQLTTGLVTEPET